MLSDLRGGRLLQPARSAGRVPEPLDVGCHGREAAHSVLPFHVLLMPLQEQGCAHCEYVNQLGGGAVSLVVVQR